MRKPIILLTLVAVGCASQQGDAPSGSAAPEPLEMSAPSGSSSELRALAILGSEDARAWSWGRRTSTGKPAHVIGRSTPLLRDGITPLAATIAFLRRFEEVFGVVDPSARFRPTRELRDDLGMTHLRLQQVERGVPVDGAELMAHYDANGALRTIDSTYVANLERLDVTPTLSAAEA
ncbi:MAG TPA: hypothetical protein VM925_18750, partial [Labilithrix sp.]|nr:hypothetical protein [Labilithrix sp.]